MDVKDSVRHDFEKWAKHWMWDVERNNDGRYKDSVVECMLHSFSAAAERYFADGQNIGGIAAYEDGYRAGFRAASGEVEQ